MPSFLEEETWLNGIGRPSTLTIRSYLPLITMCPFSTLPFCYFATGIYPGLFLLITKTTAGLPRSYTFQHNIPLLPDGPSHYETFSSIFPFFPTQQLTIPLSHFKSSVSAMSSFASYYVPRLPTVVTLSQCTPTMCLLLQFHHHTPKLPMSPV